MSPAELLLTDLRAANITVYLDPVGELRCRSRRGVLTPELRRRVAERKFDLIFVLQDEAYEIAWRVEAMKALAGDDGRAPKVIAAAFPEMRHGDAFEARVGAALRALRPGGGAVGRGTAEWARHSPAETGGGMKPARKPDRYRPPDARDQRRRRDDRARREVALIPVACASCDLDLDDARFGDEVRCPQCGAWVRAVGAHLRMVG